MFLARVVDLFGAAFGALTGMGWTPTCLPSPDDSDDKLHAGLVTPMEHRFPPMTEAEAVEQGFGTLSLGPWNLGDD